VALHLTPLEVTAGVGALTSGLAFTGAMLALAQKAKTDRRDAWWKRAQWAIDKSLSDDEQTRTVGTEGDAGARCGRQGDDCGPAGARCGVGARARQIVRAGGRWVV